MEHEVYVPFSAITVRRVFADPTRVARCVPGLRLPQDEPAEARLRVRVGPSTITYAGALAVAEHGEGYAIEAEGSEVRGDGTASLLLTVVPRPVPDGSGTTLSFTGTVEATGRLADCEPAQREAAARRLLDRFATALRQELERAEEPPPVAGGIGEPGDNERAIPGIPAPETQEREGAGSVNGSPERQSGEPLSRSGDAAATGAEAAAGPRGGGPEIDIPPPAPDSETEELAGELADELADDLAGELADEVHDDLHRGIHGELLDGSRGLDGDVPDELAEAHPGDVAAEAEVETELARAELTGSFSGPRPAEPEADFARRTMIGRSAEEVDHAPPRGRYAPAPAPRRASASAETLRWAASAAALALTSAVVVGRHVLRRRRHY